MDRVSLTSGRASRSLVAFAFDSTPGVRLIFHRSTLPLLGLLQRGDAGQVLALEPFQEGAAGARDVAHLLGDPGVRERRDRVAAAGDADRPFLRGRSDRL